MKLISLFIFLSAVFFVFGQEDSLLTFSKTDISTKYYAEYNFISTKKGAFFLSDTPTKSVKKISDKKNNNLNQIYYCSQRKNKFGPPKLVEIKFDNHIGSFFVNEDENYILFTGRQNGTASTFGVFQTQKKGNSWTKPTLVIKNLEQFNFIDPFLNESGDTIYFSSDMAGGKGGFDLYIGVGTKGSWSNFDNLGSSVNTQKNERYPSVFSNTLYFASNRENGLGGYDIYSNTIVNGKVVNEDISNIGESSEESSVKNNFSSLLLGPPINTSYDDFLVNVKKENLYFTSNREGNDDVYTITKNFPDFDCFPELPLVRCYEFSDEYSTMKDSLQYSYQWDMGDGTKYEGIVADHCFKDTGTYIVELTIIDVQTNEIVSTEASFDLLIEDPIQLELNLPEEILVGKILEFKVSDDLTADSSIYYWDFGDGNYAKGELVTHKYLQKGSFQISVGRVFFQGEEELRICTSKMVSVI